MVYDAAYWIKALGMAGHPEGGFFKETYRSAGLVEGAGEGFPVGRSYGTAIYYLLRAGEKSHLHRLKADEVWHFYAGGGLRLVMLHGDGRLEEVVLGQDHGAGEVFQVVVPAGVWFGATPLDGVAYSLVGCTMAPGFAFADFELGRVEELVGLFPQYGPLVEAFCLPE